MPNNFAANGGPSLAGGKWTDFQPSFHRGALATRLYKAGVACHLHVPSAAALSAFSAVVNLMFKHNMLPMHRCPAINIAIGDSLVLSHNFVVRRQLDKLLRLKAELAEKIEVRLPAAVLLRCRRCVLSADLEAQARAGGVCDVLTPEPFLCLPVAPLTGQSA